MIIKSGGWKMRLSMSFQTKRELLAKVALRYRESSKKQKTIILSEFILSTGYSRKYAIRLLSSPVVLIMEKIKRPRARFYDEAVQEALKVAWAAANYIASKRLAPFLEELVPSLERHGHIQIIEETRSQLISISPATIDRILKPLRSSAHGISTTKPGKLLKHQIPIRTFADWEDEEPGFFEADLVAHCGWSMEGSFLYTLVLTDVATGWVECLALLHRSKAAVIHALDQARDLIPFPILGIDTDNGSEFINADMIDYCDKEKITFTRGRAYKKNDQCYVEQKNGVVVRQIVGYDRFEGQQAYKQLTELYRAVRLYVNFFQPSMKLKKKWRISSKLRKTYYPAQTPFQRLKYTEHAGNEIIKKLNTINYALDPIRLLKQIEVLQDALWQHVIVTKQLSPFNNANAKSNESLKFQVSACGLPKESSVELNNEDLIVPPGIRKRHQYRKSKKPRVKHWWRTKKDPFENVWDEVCKWLEKNPERTATSILLQLQKKYLGEYTDGQLRTLQRRVQTWRKNAIIIYDDQWLKKGPMTKGAELGDLKAVAMEISIKKEESHFAI